MKFLQICLTKITQRFLKKNGILLNTKCIGQLKLPKFNWIKNQHQKGAAGNTVFLQAGMKFSSKILAVN